MIWVIKSRRIEWVEHVACMGRDVNTQFWWGNPREGDHLEDLGNRWEDNNEMLIKNRLGGYGINYLAQDRDRWWAFVNIAMNLWVA
jgi:hypothetical protein